MTFSCWQQPQGVPGVPHAAPHRDIPKTFHGFTAQFFTTEHIRNICSCTSRQFHRQLPDQITSLWGLGWNPGSPRTFQAGIHAGNQALTSRGSSGRKFSSTARVRRLCRYPMVEGSDSSSLQLQSNSSSRDKLERETPR